MTAELPHDSPRLSIVIPTLGNHVILKRVLDAYSEQDVAPGTFEVLVVADQAEPDPAAVDAAIGERSYPIRRLTGRIPGASANRNTGWRAARAPLVLFTDNDTIPVHQLVAEHLAWHDRFPGDEMVIVGLIRWARGLRVTPFMRWLDDGMQFDFHNIVGEEASWAHIYSANASMKRSFLERVGGYDELNLPYLYEDLDWGYRARDHGVRVMLNRRAIVDHWRPMDIEVWQGRAPQLARSEWTFCTLHPDFQPWFHRLFSEAAASPGRGPMAARITRFVPQSTPWLGPRVWRRASVYWRQQIAPYFLRQWDELEAQQRADVRPS